MSNNDDLRDGGRWWETYSPDLLRAPEGQAGPQPLERVQALPWHLLSARQLEVIGLLYRDGLSLAEAARALGVDESTVRKRANRAISLLKGA